MTTFIPFTPSQAAPFQFQPTLDGTVYNAIVTWNLFAQRYYVNLYTLDGTLVFSLPLIGSPVGAALALLAWNLNNTTVTATTQAPHGYRIGQTLDLVISGASPDAYNGTFECFVMGPSTFTYTLASDPGVNTVPGNFSYDISLCAGYFNAAGALFVSTLVYRPANRQFETSP